MVSLVGLVGGITVLKFNGPPKLAVGLIIVPLGVVLLIQLFGLFISTSPNSLMDIMGWVAIAVIMVLFLAPYVYLNRKLSHKFRLSREESIKFIISLMVCSFIGSLVMGIMTLSTVEEWPPRGLDLIIFLIIMPLSITFFYTSLGWFIIRRFSKTAPSRIAYILPDWLLRIFDPFYIPPYGKKERKNKTGKT